MSKKQQPAFSGQGHETLRTQVPSPTHGSPAAAASPQGKASPSSYLDPARHRRRTDFLPQGVPSEAKVQPSAAPRTSQQAWGEASAESSPTVSVSAWPSRSISADSTVDHATPERHHRVEPDSRGVPTVVPFISSPVVPPSMTDRTAYASPHHGAQQQRVAPSPHRHAHGHHGHHAQGHHMATGGHRTHMAHQHQPHHGHGRVHRALHASASAASPSSTASPSSANAMAQEAAQLRTELARQRHRFASELAAVKQENDQLRAVLQRRELADARRRESGASKAATVARVRQQTARLRADLDDVRRDVGRMSRLFQDQFVATVVASVRDMAERTTTAVDKYQTEHQERRRLHNLVQDLRGAVRVCCRIRPIVDRREGREMVAVQDDIVAVADRTEPFTFDEVFGPRTSQREVFDTLKPLITSVADGYNVCVFAFGQTGSGKTHTMLGSSADDPGLAGRTFDELFRLIDRRKDDCQVTVDVSMLEIYLDQLYDLLADDGAAASASRLRISHDDDGNVVVPGLASLSVTTPDELMHLLHLGTANRAQAATNINAHSSRSHLVLTATVTSRNRRTGLVLQGKLNLVDLAGSERVSKSGSTGVRLGEAKFINGSLSALSTVYLAVGNKAGHVPYRNSQLTYLLADSIGGKSKTLFILCASPGADDVPETTCTLRFGSRLRTVETGQVRRNATTAAGH